MIVKRTYLKQLLSFHWFVLGAASLSFCFASRNALDLDALFHPGQQPLTSIILLQVSRIVPLLIVLYCYRRDAKASKNFRPLLVTHPIRLLFVALFESLGMGFLFLADHNAAFFLGSIPLDRLFFGIGNSLLLAAIAEFFLVHERQCALMGLSVSLILAGLVELTLSIIQVDISSMLRIVFPFVSCFLLIEAHRRSSSKPAKNAKDHRGLAEETALSTPSKKNLYILLACIGSYAFIFCSLKTTWISSSIDTEFAAFTLKLSAIIGLLLAGLLVYALIDVERKDKGALPVSSILVPLIMASLYVSTFLSNEFAFLYVASLFAARKIMLFMIWNISLKFLKRRMRMRIFIYGIICLEVGFLVYYCLEKALAVLAFPVEQTMSILVVILLVAILAYELITWLSDIRSRANGSSAPDDATVCAELKHIYGLTARESEVLPFLAHGRNADYVAKQLVIAPTTAKSHISHIYQKMSINSQQQLMDIVEEKRVELQNEKV